MNREVILLIAEFLIRLFVIVALPMLYKLVKKYKLEKTIQNAVWAAEQLFKKNDQTGEKRKEYVINYLSNKGVKLTIEDLDVLIEAAVRELNIIQKEALE